MTKQSFTLGVRIHLQLKTVHLYLQQNTISIKLQFPQNKLQDSSDFYDTCILFSFFFIQVSNNPFKNWAVADKQPIKAVRSDLFDLASQMDTSLPTTSTQRNRNMRNKRKEPC